MICDTFFRARGDGMQELRGISRWLRVAASMAKDGLPVENLQRPLDYAGSRWLGVNQRIPIQPLINDIHKPGTR